MRLQDCGAACALGEAIRIWVLGEGRTTGHSEGEFQINQMVTILTDNTESLYEVGDLMEHWLPQGGRLMQKIRGQLSKGVTPNPLEWAAVCEHPIKRKCLEVLRDYYATGAPRYVPFQNPAKIFQSLPSHTWIGREEEGRQLTREERWTTIRTSIGEAMLG